MGTIGSALSGYYQLSSLLSSGSGGSLSSPGASSNNTLETLAQVLDASGSSNSGSSDGFVLDLSPQAQQLLNGGGAGSGSGSSTFTLTQTQQTAIENIVEKYKDAPLTQATFDEIQSALQAAGLSPQTLAAEDQVNSFDPTNVLISALGGNYENIQTPAASASTEQTKEASYMQSIVSLWKNDVSSVPAAGSSSSS